jgi:hypothetical protein
MPYSPVIILLCWSLEKLSMTKGLCLRLRNITLWAKPKPVYVFVFRYGDNRPAW